MKETVRVIVLILIVLVLDIIGAGEVWAANSCQMLFIDVPLYYDGSSISPGLESNFMSMPNSLSTTLLPESVLNKNTSSFPKTTINPVNDPVAAINLPKTGQTRCYSPSGLPISCLGTGQDGETQAGTLWPDPRFSPGQGPEGECIIDSLTGLMWAKNGNLTNGSVTWTGALDFIAGINTGSGLCGYNDWRLPNIVEMESLINADAINPAGWLNLSEFSNIQDDAYWSSTTGSGYPDVAWFIDYGGRSRVPEFSYIGKGSIAENFKSSLYFMLPVRTGGTAPIAPLWKTGQTIQFYPGDDGALQLGTAWPEQRFSYVSIAQAYQGYWAPINHAFLITDTLTGLVWLDNVGNNYLGPCYSGQTQNYDYVNYVSCLNVQGFLGYYDWRIPNRKELLSLNDFSKHHPGVAYDAQWPMTSYLESFCSATVDPVNPEEKWTTQLFFFGGIYIDQYSSLNSVLAIRGGEIGNLMPSSVQGSTIRGRITENGTGLGGVTVALSGTVSSKRTTDINGDYAFALMPDGSYTITPSKSPYIFSLDIRSVIVNRSDMTDQDFSATYYPRTNFYAWPYAGGAPLVVYFYDNSANTPTSWFWDFGDGGTSTEQNPVHVYSASAKYTVSLTTTGIVGPDTKIITDYIRANPCTYEKVYNIEKNQYKQTIQAAYSDADSGNTIGLQAVDIVENVDLDLGKAITLAGGYACNFCGLTSIPARLTGYLSINTGSVTVDGCIVIQ